MTFTGPTTKTVPALLTKSYSQRLHPSGVACLLGGSHNIFRRSVSPMTLDGRLRVVNAKGMVPTAFPEDHGGAGGTRRRRFVVATSPSAQLRCRRWVLRIPFIEDLVVPNWRDLFRMGDQEFITPGELDRPLEFSFLRAHGSPWCRPFWTGLCQTA